MRELRGMPAAKAILADMQVRVDGLKEKGIVPKLTVVRVGAREDDLSYERGIYKRFEGVGAKVETIELPLSVTQEELENVIVALNQDASVHGVLLFRPLPKTLDEVRIKTLLAEEKDVDCLTSANDAHLFAGDKKGYPPCTPQAVMEILKHYQIDLTGKKVTVVGRSMVVGKPVAMLLLAQNATVTICHTRTKNLQAECRNADIIVACAGVPKMITSDFVREGQVIIDVGIHVVDDKLCGDVDYEQVAEMVEAITPVPGGVGSVTTTVLLKHVVMSAEKIVG
ncbi:MAG: bifunctional 5,10-methylenetetrahydrofolate dehydrogenase/5,10-methenyltetrahydrofolate cyclohydrolase [Lachnospiraceae bacterium]|nr:bifunctional 5,10-methylenetetrahydrofolate dehydrogenase/5,10-methenyltetrahydrofolate cyclohydrolase [Lachnospiraceae bacterium]